MRTLANDLDLDVRHRTFVLQDSEDAMAERWGTPEHARKTILGHWATCRRVSDRPDLVDIKAMRNAEFPYPHGYLAARTCKAADAMGGQAAHWDMFDRLQRAHFSEARNIADRQTVWDLGVEMGFEHHDFGLLLGDVIVAAGVEADRNRVKALQVTSVPTLIVRQTGTRLVDGPIEDLRARFGAAARLAERGEGMVSCAS